MTVIADALRITLATFLDGKLTTQAFCDRYEMEFNTPDQVDWASSLEANVFQDLFDIVVWYSPFDEDRRRFSGYVGESQILSAAKTAAERLGLSRRP